MRSLERETEGGVVLTVLAVQRLGPGFSASELTPAKPKKAGLPHKQRRRACLISLGLTLGWYSGDKKIDRLRNSTVDDLHIKCTGPGAIKLTEKNPLPLTQNQLAV